MEAQTTYGAIALIPVVIAIVMAIWKRQVIVSLLLGIWVGATIIAGYNPVLGLLNTFSTYIVKNSLADAWNIGIIVFCLAIGGMVGVISKMGGTAAIGDALKKKARDVKSTQLATALMGFAIFFDDYANSMVVGNIMRPVTDQRKISREKLAYIVDSTAAPVSSMAPISTWIAMELGLIASSLEVVNIKANSMGIFFMSIPFRFYSLFAIAMVFILIFQKRDFGAMLKAEMRSRKTGQTYDPESNPMVADDQELFPDEGVTGSVWDSILPILCFVGITIGGLWYNGYAPGKSIRDAFGAADASVVLTWAAFISSMFGICMGVMKKRFTLTKGVDAWVAGLKTMVVACIILTLAFALKSVITEMKLADWLVAISKGYLSGGILPLITFLAAMVIAFATGTSWGTNSILMPIVIPVAAAVSQASGDVTPLVIATIGSVLTGAVFGDHCSPISDTTILSSMAAGSDHIDHVKTQMPYAITAGIIAVVCGFLPSGFGVSPWICLPVGLIALWVVVRTIGREIDDNGEIIG